MGALRDFLPRTESPRKPAARARKPKDGASGACKPRTWNELDAAFRAGSSYERVSGWAPLHFDFSADLFRLSSGMTCTHLALFLLADLGRQRKGAEPLPTETRAFLISEVATLLSVDERSVNRELQYMHTRGMAVVSRLDGGRAVVTLLFPKWPAIDQSYKEWAAARAAEEAANAAEDDSADDTTEDTTKVKAGTVPLTKAPVVVKGGHRSRSLPVKCGVKSTGVIWDSPGVDVQFTAVVESGELLWRGKLNAEKTVESNVYAKRADSTTSNQSRGHIRPDNAKSPANAGSVKHPHGGVSHPRAAELAAIFDPLIIQSCGKSLSSDVVAWQSACDVVGDTDHDYLQEQAFERASRPLTPKHVVAFCREMNANWQKIQSLPPELRNAKVLSKQDQRAERIKAGMRAMEESRRRLK